MHEYASDPELRPGDVILLEGGYWLLERIATAAGEAPARALAKPARYRLELRHPGGQLEAGAFRRFRAGGPKLGHAFTTLQEGQPVSWQVVDQQLTRDEQGEPYLNLVAERDYGELEPLPDHELEHALAGEEELPEAAATLSEAEQAWLAMELVALDPGEEPDWAAAARFIDSLVLEEVEEDVLVLCGVDPRVDPREAWLETVKGRLRADLERFRADIEGEHDQIEEWDFRGGRIFASSGSFDDEADPDSGHGWMCRLLESEALGAAGFERIRKTDLL